MSGHLPHASSRIDERVALQPPAGSLLRSPWLAGWVPTCPWARRLTPAAPRECFLRSHAQQRCHQCVNVYRQEWRFLMNVSYSPINLRRWENKASYQSVPFTVYKLCFILCAFNTVLLWMVRKEKKTSHKSLSIPPGRVVLHTGRSERRRGGGLDSLRGQTYLWRRRWHLLPAGPA